MFSCAAVVDVVVGTSVVAAAVAASTVVVVLVVPAVILSCYCSIVLVAVADVATAAESLKLHDFLAGRRICKLNLSKKLYVPV